jgi:SSS family solute:Na+ symporter
LLCVVYTVLGGIEAVIWTDVAQSFVLLGAALVSLAYIVLHVDGGVATVWHTAVSHGKLHWANWTLDPSATADAFWVILLGNLFVVLIPYTSDQTVVQRYMTTHDPKQAARSIWTNALLSIPSTVLFFAIGTALFVYYQSNPQALDPAVTTDAIFPAFIVQSLPVGIAGLVIAGIFAAAQSTVSSSINSVATALVTDFYVRLGGTAGEQARLRLARVLTAIIGVFATLAALVLAELQQRSLWDSYNTLVGLAASGLAGLFALGIFTRRAHGTGALVGAITSAVVLYFVERRTDIHFFLYAGIGIITCVVVGWLASLVLPAAMKPIDGLTVYTMEPDVSSR